MPKVFKTIAQIVKSLFSQMNYIVLAEPNKASSDIFISKVAFQGSHY